MDLTEKAIDAQLIKNFPVFNYFFIIVFTETYHWILH
jgi:hypothetical protein